MSTYFAFSDESGQYAENAGDRFCVRYPYYVRSVVLLEVQSWMSLKGKFSKLKGDYGLPPEREIKWSYLWSLRKHRQNKETIPSGKPYYFLREVPDEKLLSFVADSCKLLNECTYCKLLFTVTFNSERHSIGKALLYKWHLQELMQRINMEIQSNPDNLAIIFFDPTNREPDSLIRSAYREIYSTGDFVKEYLHIKDSISFELSHHSFGIQMADYTAGIFNGFVKGFRDSERLFVDYLFSLVRKDVATGEILGYGIREVPKNPEIRRRLQARLSHLG